MKTIILFFVIIAIGKSSFSQTSSSNVKSKEFYLAKSQHQRTLARIMLGGGAALTGIGFLAGTAEALSTIQGSSKSNNTGATLATVGIISMLGSIPLFICSSHNKRKGAAIAFNMQTMPILVTQNNPILRQSVLSVKVSF